MSGSVAVLNAVGAGLRALGVGVDHLSEEHLLRAAQRRVGLSDFGDARFRIPLRMLIRSYNEETGPMFVARVFLRRRIIGKLVNRLLITDELKRHPEIRSLPIRRPIIIASLPRTGTTFLHRLLAQDPNARPVLGWETMMPARHPADIARGRDPRIKRARRFANVVRFLAPGFQKVREVDPEGPEECAKLVSNTFFLATQASPIYREWFLRQPATVAEAAYCEYRQQLQLLHWQRPHDGHWLLKAPVHSYAIEALLAVFPDAAIVLIHRDPAKVIGSVCGLASWSVVHPLKAHSRVPGDTTRRGAVGPGVVGWVGEALRRSEAARAHAEAGRIYDIRYQELVADPLGTVQGLYAHFGYPYTREFEERARVWLKEHPQHKHGEHRYRLEEFGLEPRAIDEAFAWYRDRHDIPRESAGARPAPR